MSDSNQSKDVVERVVETVAKGVALEVGLAAAAGFIVAGPAGAVAAVKSCGLASAVNAACEAGKG